MLRDLIHTMRHIAAHPLNRGRRLAAFGRYFSWQLRSRFTDEAVVPFAGSTRLYARRSLTGVTGNIYSGLHEYQDMGFLLHVLRPGDMFYDVGANIGSYTVLASGVAGARSIAFEPVPETCAMLSRNIALNGIGSLARAEMVGIGDEPGVIAFTTALGAVNRAVLPDDPPDIAATEVAIRSIDSYAAAEPPTLIKMDVEGFEAKALAGAAKTLADPSLLAVIIELNGNAEMFGQTIGDLAGILRSNGLQPCRYDPLTRALTPAAIATGEGHAIGYADNVLFVRDIGAAAQRVESAPKILVAGRLV